MSTPARVIAVTSGKGGVGKTHTSVNLGLALTQQGKRVLLLDADLGLANINIMLGFEPAATLREVLTKEASIEDVIVSHDLGFDIIPSGSGFPELSNLSEEERALLVEALDELGSNYDYMIVDTGAGIGSNVMYFCTAAEEIFVVVDCEPTSRTDAYALIKVLTNNHGVKNFSIIANRTPRGGDGKTTYGQLAAACDRFLNVSLKYLGSISDDSAVSEAVVAQRPFLELYPSTRASLDITKIAKKVLESEGRRNPSGGMQFFFKALLENH
ncbi:MAG: MinD/ParA family protein [Bdellovibrionales bacterium]|nr:MinD/ParA family protein [Bdellovibrionales bacterium]